MDYEKIPYEVAPMATSDIPAVMQIERQSFPTPWTPQAYRYELNHNRNAHYFVVRPRRAPQQSPNGYFTTWRSKLRRLLGISTSSSAPILGYIGFWLVAGEAHISTIAVHPEARRNGLGELLLIRVIEAVLERNGDFITLEVRVSNQAAQQLYEKFGFKRTGRRTGYYSDNREDAWIMTADELDSPRFRTLFEHNRRALRQKLSEVQLEY